MVLLLFASFLQRASSENRATEWLIPKLLNRWTGSVVYPFRWNKLKRNLRRKSNTKWKSYCFKRVLRYVAPAFLASYQCSRMCTLYSVFVHSIAVYFPFWNFIKIKKIRNKIKATEYWERGAPSISSLITHRPFSIWLLLILILGLSSVV